jgi:hypothetical protein
MKWEAGISGMRRGWCGISAFFTWGVEEVEKESGGEGKRFRCIFNTLVFLVEAVWPMLKNPTKVLVWMHCYWI